jgi:exodeoxyribonuclease VII small subunit
MTTKTDPKDLKFEQALQVLESISAKISNTNNDLDEMLVLYEQGLEYLKICREKLAEAEMKVQILNEKMKLEIPGEDENG